MEDFADVFHAAGGKSVVVFTYLICGLRKHQESAFATGGTEIPAVRAFIVLQNKARNTNSGFSETVCVSEGWVSTTG